MQTWTSYVILWVLLIGLPTIYAVCSQAYRYYILVLWSRSDTCILVDPDQHDKILHFCIGLTHSDPEPLHNVFLHCQEWDRLQNLLNVTKFSIVNCIINQCVCVVAVRGWTVKSTRLKLWCIWSAERGLEFWSQFHRAAKLENLLSMKFITWKKTGLPLPTKLWKFVW